MYIDIIAVLSTRKVKSRAQLTPMRTTVAYTRNKIGLCLTYNVVLMHCSVGIHPPTQSQRLEYNLVPFRGRRQGSRMFSSQWTFRLGWPLGRVLLELKAVMAVNERN